MANLNVSTLIIHPCSSSAHAESPRHPNHSWPACPPTHSRSSLSPVCWMMRLSRAMMHERSSRPESSNKSWALTARSGTLNCGGSRPWEPPVWSHHDSVGQDTIHGTCALDRRVVWGRTPHETEAKLILIVMMSQLRLGLSLHIMHIRPKLTPHTAAGYHLGCQC